MPHRDLSFPNTEEPLRGAELRDVFIPLLQDKLAEYSSIGDRLSWLRNFLYYSYNTSSEETVQHLTAAAVWADNATHAVEGLDINLNAILEAFDGMPPDDQASFIARILICVADNTVGPSSQLPDGVRLAAMASANRLGHFYAG